MNEINDLTQWRIAQGIFTRRDWDGKDAAFRWCLGACNRLFRVSNLIDGYCEACSSHDRGNRKER